jgi:hypothetical protein
MHHADILAAVLRRRAELHAAADTDRCPTAKALAELQREYDAELTAAIRADADAER